MKITYKKLLHKNLLVLSDFQTENYSEGYQIKMLTRNSIPGLLNAETDTVNLSPSLSYDISLKHSLASLLTDKKIDYGLLSSIISHLYSLLDTLEQFMLDSRFLLLSPDLIFLSSDFKTPFFCYCPITEEENKSSAFTQELTHFLEYIITKLDYNDKDCVALCYSLHQKCIDGSLSDSDLFIMQDIPKASDNCEISALPATDDNGFDAMDFSNNEEASPMEDTPYVYTCNIFKKLTSVGKILDLPSVWSALFAAAVALMIITLVCGFFLYITGTISSILAFVIALSGPILFAICLPSFARKRKLLKYKEETLKEDTLSNENVQNTIMEVGETVLIGRNSELIRPHLIYAGSDYSHDVTMESFPFTVGKLAGSCDLHIDNVLISRLHARFFCRDNRYYIEDLNSSNGTYLNDKTLSPHTLTEIHNDDSITFANIAYIFKA